MQPNPPLLSSKAQLENKILHRERHLQASILSEDLLEEHIFYEDENIAKNTTLYFETKDPFPPEAVKTLKITRVPSKKSFKPPRKGLQYYSQSIAYTKDLHLLKFYLKSNILQVSSIKLYFDWEDDPFEIQKILKPVLNYAPLVTQSLEFDNFWIRGRNMVKILCACERVKKLTFED